MKYICSNCGYIYDEKEGDSTQSVKPGTKFEDLPSNWVCPICYATKDKFDIFD